MIIALIRKKTFIAGSRQIGDALAFDLVYRLGDDPILEEGLGIIDDIVRNDITAGISQLDDALGKISLTVVGCMESQLSAGRHIMDDLGHGPSLIRAIGVQVFQYLHGLFIIERIARTRQFAVEYARTCAAKIVIAVGEDTDLDAGAIHFVFFSGQGGALRCIALVAYRRGFGKPCRALPDIMQVTRHCSPAHGLGLI